MNKISYLTVVATILLFPCVTTADFPRDRQWRTTETTYFTFHYTNRSQFAALEVMDYADSSFEKMAEWTKFRPKSQIHVVVIADNDFTNGSATPYPHNHIRLYTMAPRHPSQLIEYDDWLKLLFVHELTHIFHIDMHRLPGTIFRKIFGRNFVQAISTDRSTYPLGFGFANGLLPDTFKEGYAVWAESSLYQQRGRANGAFSRALIRNMARDDALLPLGQSVGLRREFPGGAAGYLYGGSFHRFMNRDRKADLSDFYQLNSTSLFPFFYGVPYWIRMGNRQ